MLAGLLQRAILGPRQYLKQSDLDKMTRRTPFSSFLNYLAYYPELEVFLNQDGSLGMLWECSPVIYSGPKTITSLEGLFRGGASDLYRKHCHFEGLNILPMLRVNTNY